MVKFTGPYQVEAGGETFEGEKIFIDTGTRPDIPKIAGIDSVPFLTNVSIMELLEVPKHCLYWVADISGWSSVKCSGASAAA